MRLICKGLTSGGHVAIFFTKAPFSIYTLPATFKGLMPLIKIFFFYRSENDIPAYSFNTKLITYLSILLDRFDNAFPKERKNKK